MRNELYSAGIAITGSGSGIPSGRLTNQDLAQMVETSDEWITTRTGIKQRCLTASGESLKTIGAQAAHQALAMAQVAPEEIDLLILATSTPDDLFGSAVSIQTAIGANHAVAFDLTAACSGFVFGLVNSAQFIRTGAYQKVLLIGADVLSRWVDWSDRSTCILFGDGAGAVVIEATSAERDRLLGFELCSDGQLSHTLNLGYHGSEKTIVDSIEVNQGHYQPITMKGKEVYRFAVEKVPEVISKALFHADLTSEDVDWLLLHQANQRIMDAVAQRLSLPPERVISNLANFGNTSAGSIPLALDEAQRAGKLQSGDIIAMSGFGAGLTWGSAIVQWQIEP
ncbi:3-oxoacyl-(acyl-carrier-protein) synthase III [Halothece sp. PCC 7418]|uniref:beta-ketoacyl-ACP synthase 3 n=1 Tax=Halothece sp. (strain PCC 7418) TaxID=65093 RepID=UPI0002A08CCB|nr:beta-ketoacyl-ACP synthase 3 [Halothece sp. PCC 7418]AFZ45531.1 3-oxoacyl-(acyl-carrier-protein) synthase III [Halothece sp. PCC 7418]